MKNILNYSILLLLLVHINASAQHITDILVHTEPDSNDFNATSTSLHVLSPDKFMVIWLDDRGVPDQAWANIFDQNGNELYTPFKVPGDTYVSAEDDKYTILSKYYSQSGFLENYDFQHFQNDTNITKQKEIESIFYNPCDYFNPIEKFELYRTQERNIWIKNNCGSINIAIQDSHFSTLIPDFYPLYIDYWDNENNHGYEELVSNYSIAQNDDKSQSWMLTLHPGVFLDLIDIDKPSHSDLIAKKIYLDSIDYDFEQYWANAQMITDSTILFLWATRDTLRTIQLDTSSTILEKQNYYIGDEQYYSDIYHISNESNNIKYLLAGNHFRAKIIKIKDDLVESISDNYLDLPQSLNRKKFTQIFLNENEEMFLPAVDNNQAKLFKIKNNSISQFKTLKAPDTGANQECSHIRSIDDNNFAVTFKESGVSKTAKMSVYGTIINQEMDLPSANGMFFNNGTELVTLVKNMESNILQMKKYDLQTNTILLEKTLFDSTLTFYFEKLNDSSFVVFNLLENRIHFALFNSNGDIIGETSILNPFNNGEQFIIAKLPDTKIWFHSNFNYFLFDPQSFSVQSFSGLYGQSKFFPVTESKLVNHRNGTFTIIDTSGTILKQLETSFNYYGSLNVLPLNDDTFLFNSAYSAKFQLITTELEFYTQSTLSCFPKRTLYNMTDFTYERIGNHIVFACTDIRDTETGQNVYASIFNINDLITGIDDAPISQQVPNRFSLSEPSPNPSRAGQSISFQLDIHKQSKMDFQLYNILGQRIQTFNRQFNAGQQSVRFQLPNLAAGIYFLKATDSQQAIIKKIAVVR